MLLIICKLCEKLKAFPPKWKETESLNISFFKSITDLFLVFPKGQTRLGQENISVNSKFCITGRKVT